MKQRQLIKFFTKTIILLIVLFICDRAIGWLLEDLFYKQKHGDDFVSIYLLEKSHEDLLIFGGSRASHNFNATLLQDSTHMSTFNGGRDEMNIVYTAAALPIAAQHHMPKVVIMEMIPTELSGSKHDLNVKFQHISTVLLPFLHRHPQLLSTIKLAPDNDALKAKLSHIYPYNSTIASSIQNTYTHLGHVSVKGYEPLYGVIDTGSYKTSIWGNYPDNAMPADPILIDHLAQVIRMCREDHIRLITIIAPFYFPFNFSRNSSYQVMKKMMADAGYELYDFTNDSRFLGKPRLFSDDVHLNDSGATIFTKEVVKIINRQPGAGTDK